MIHRLSHAEVAVTDLERARHFYVDVLGLIVHDGDDQALWLRGSEEFDLWSLKLVLGDEAGLVTFGLRVDSEQALDDLAAQHAALGLPHRWRERGAEPGRGRTLRVRTPAGHVVDFQHEIDELPPPAPDDVRLPMRSSHALRGASPSRLDHVNLRVVDVPAAVAYWRDRLGFSISEMVQDDGRPRIVWMRRTPSSHDVAVGPAPVPGLHHVAYAMRDSHALVAAADVLSDAGYAGALEYGPGRHGATDAFFLYIKDPDGTRIELYAGDYLRDLDRPPIVWGAEQYAERGLLWWGQAPPASFREPTPLVERGALGEATLTGDAA